MRHYFFFLDRLLCQKKTFFHKQSSVILSEQDVSKKMLPLFLPASLPRYALFSFPVGSFQLIFLYLTFTTNQNTANLSLSGNTPPKQKTNKQTNRTAIRHIFYLLLFFSLTFLLISNDYKMPTWCCFMSFCFSLNRSLNVTYTTCKFSLSREDFHAAVEQFSFPLKEALICVM